MRLISKLQSALIAAVCTATASAQAAYLVDSDLDQLFSLDLTNGAVTFIASTANNGLGTPAGLAWRDDVMELWTIDLAGGEVGPIDVTSGTFTPVLQSGLSGWQDLAWDPNAHVFYLANQNGSNYILDPVSGATTLLGPAGFGLITAMDFDPAGNLWGTDFGGAIVSIDLVTGAGTSTVSTSSNIQGLGIDASGVWYGVNTTTDSLYSIDPVTGLATLIGPNPGILFAKGMDVVTSGGNSPIGTNYCVTNPNSTGASGRIDAYGSRVVADNDVTLVASNLPANAFLFFLVSRTQGQINNPGGSQGNLCLGSPIGRYVGPGQIQNSGAMGMGSYMIDLNQVPTPTGFVAAMPGQTLNFQAWHRDVIAGSAVSNFTDGTGVLLQ